MTLSGKIAGLFALFLWGAAVARAHDPLTANTNLWLRPDQMDVEIILSRGSARMLTDQPSSAPVTEENFASVYHASLKKSAEQMLAITLDGKPLRPLSTEVALFEDTDVQFTFVYPRPPGGRLQVTANFIKKMSEGFDNSLGLNEDRKVLGYSDQTIDNLTWEITLSTDTRIAPPPDLAHPPPSAVTTSGPAATTASTASKPVNIGEKDTYFIIPHFHYLTLAGILGVIILLAIWCVRQKSAP